LAQGDVMLRQLPRLSEQVLPIAKRLCVIDGSILLHRAYHAPYELTDSEGGSVNVAYGFLKSFLRLWKRFPSSHIVVAFDAHKVVDGAAATGTTGSWRKLEVPEYKSNRPK